MMNVSQTAPRLVYLVTHPITAHSFFRGHLSRMRAWGFDVTLISAPGKELASVAQSEGVPVVEIPMSREMAPMRDWRTLWHIRRALRKIQPHIVNASTPKAGLLGMMAAASIGVPIRLYWLHGLRLETAGGALRQILKFSEWMTARCAHRVYCVSESLRETYLAHGFCVPEKTHVFGHGACSGVEAARFAFDPQRREEIIALRHTLGIPPDAPIVGYVGRFVRDKGIFELLDAFDRLRDHVQQGNRGKPWLVMLGDNLGGDRAGADLAARIAATPGVKAVEYTMNPAPFYWLMDFLVLPSYREGFPNTPLEAAAAGIPTIGCRATGTVDAIIDGVTGRLVDPRDVAALTASMLDYLRNAELCRRHGQTAHDRVRRDFVSLDAYRAWGREYCRWLRIRRLPLPAAVAELDLD